jgi:phosphoribosylformimino-5-aminoimidazole carboxamide ribonucleotide (ProFAR) isomerase
MELIPALDLRRGRAVRLQQGDGARATVYGDDPGAVLAGFARAGVRRIHLVDLDAALGEAPQRALIRELLQRAMGPAQGNADLERSQQGPKEIDLQGADRFDGINLDGIKFQLGGGLREGDSIAEALAAGCERAVVGSLVARRPERFAELARAYPGRLVPALDVERGEVRIAGWTERAPSSLADLAQALRGLPCPAVLVTDVERDGMMVGPNLELACRVASLSGLPALLSGGVKDLRDLETARRRPEIAGAIVGRALYEGAFGLAEALAICAA